MNKQFYLLITGILYIPLAFAQTSQGARLTAMGNNGTAVSDIWGVATNPAAIKNIVFPTFQLNYQKHYFSTEIRNEAFAFVLPINRQLFGLHVSRYGIAEYHLLKVSFVATRQFGPKLAIGLRTNYHQQAINHYGTTSGISLDIGSIYQVSDKLTFGFYINNFPTANYHFSNIDIPLAMYFGIAYQANNKLLVAGALNKEDVAIGLDYKPIPLFALRVGLSVNPFTHYFGVGFNKSKLIIDISFTKHIYFGYSPQFTIGYVF